MIKKRAVAWTAAVLAVLLTAACGQNTGHDGAGGHETHREANGDLLEKTASSDQLPSFLNHHSKEVALAYQVAASMPDVLEYIPCYCGCGESAGHRSNRDCFIDEFGSDGSVVWNDHGSRCGVCIEIAVISARMKQQGKTTREIRAYVDETYKNGYAKPTNTEMPS
jgi:hypothetical protein